jgi:hypothetical protein
MESAFTRLMATFSQLFPTSMAHRHARVLRGKARRTWSITHPLFSNAIFNMGKVRWCGKPTAPDGVCLQEV